MVFVVWIWQPPKIILLTMPPLMKLIFPLLPNSFVFKPITTLDYSSFSSPTQAHTPSSPTSLLLYNFTTPMVGGQSLSSVCPPFADITLYFSLVGALQYLTSIRHDLTHCQLCRLVLACSHWDAFSSCQTCTICQGYSSLWPHIYSFFLFHYYYLFQYWLGWLLRYSPLHHRLFHPPWYQSCFLEYKEVAYYFSI